MGIDSKFFEATSKLGSRIQVPPRWKSDNPESQDTGDFRIDGDGEPFLSFAYPTPHDHLDTVVFIDAPDILHWYRNLPDGVSVNVIAQKNLQRIEHYINPRVNPRIKRVVLAMDLSTPPQKTVTRQKKENTPPTIFPPKNKESGKSLRCKTYTKQAFEYWDSEMRKRVSNHDEYSEATDVPDGLFLSRRLFWIGDVMLPGVDMGNPQDKATLGDFLANKHFKDWLMHAVAVATLRLLKSKDSKAANTPGVTVTLIAPSLCVDVRGGEEFEPDYIYQYRYGEADNSVGYWVRMLGKKHNIYFDSNDGDVVVAGVLAADMLFEYRKTKQPRLPRIPVQQSQLLALRHQWTKHGKHVIDIGQLWYNLHYIANKQKFTPERIIRTFSPVDAWALAALLTGNDFYCKQDLFPQMSVGKFLPAWKKSGDKELGGELCRRSGERLLLNRKAFRKFILMAYNEQHSKLCLLEEPTVEAAFAKLESAPSVKTSLEKVDIAYAQMCWIMQYFYSPRFPEDMLLTGHASSASAMSHGYEFVNPNSENPTDEYGFTMMRTAEKIDFDYLQSLWDMPPQREHRMDDITEK